MWGRSVLNARALGLGLACSLVLSVGGRAPGQDHKPPPGGQPQIVRVALAKSLPRGISRTPQLDAVVSQLRSGKTDGAMPAWRAFVTANRAPGGKKLDLDTLVAWVLRKAYVEPNKDLKEAADRVHFFDKLTRGLRKEIASAKRDLANAKSWPLTRRTITFRTKYVEGLDPVLGSALKSISQTDLQSYVAGMENELNSVGDDSQLANVDLQNVLQQQQQTLQMLSDISKELYDTAMSVIRKIGG